MGHASRLNPNTLQFRRGNGHQSPTPTAPTQLETALDQSLHGVRDRFNQLVKPNDLVLYTPPIPMVFQVVSVTPVLDPRAPTGTIQLVLSCTAPLPVVRHRPMGNLLRVGQLEESTGTTPQEPDGNPPDAGPGEDPPQEPPQDPQAS
jgi:hypothetical protein